MRQPVGAGLATAARPTRGVDEAFFFEAGAVRLFGVWRAPVDAAPKRVWVFCPPFAEEEKSARRTTSELADALVAMGDGALVFSYRGTGDSEGEFSAATLADWEADITAACAEARRRTPGAPLCLAGLRLGASLALKLAAEVGAERLVLLEPVLQGKTLLASLQQKKRLRSMMTKAEGGDGSTVPVNLPDATPDDADDFDGWPLGAELRSDLQQLDVSSAPPFAGEVLVLQIGPRESLLPATEQWANSQGAQARALKMQPYWNLIDYARADELFATLSDW